MRADPALFEQVKKGKVTAHAASSALRLKESDPELYEQLKQGEPPKRQKGVGSIRINKTAPYVATSKRQQRNAGAQKSKMIEAVSIVSGICHGLVGLDVLMIAAVCDQKEISVWAFKAEESGKSIFRFAHELRKAEIHAGKTTEDKTDES